MENRGKSQRTGILGGTFNPPHIGHLILADRAMEEAGLDEVIFLPSGIPYMKKQADVLPGEDRFHMMELAVAGKKDFSVSDAEIVRSGRTYTCDTLSFFNRLYPENEIFFIMGADCLFSIEKWKEPEKIFAACTVIAAARNGSPLKELEQKRRELEERFFAHILLLQLPEIDISSTDIRERIKTGKTVRFMVPDDVIEYIEKRGFYQG